MRLSSQRHKDSLSNKVRYKNGAHSPVLNCSYRSYAKRWIVMVSNGKAKVYGGCFTRLFEAQAVAVNLNKQCNRREWPLLSEAECDEWDIKLGAAATPRVRPCRIAPETIASWDQSTQAGCSIAHLSRSTGVSYFTIYYHLQKLHKKDLDVRD